MESEDKSSLSGFFRAQVTDNKDPELCGRVRLNIPDIMPGVTSGEVAWARPANNPVGGLNVDGDSQHFYSGSCYVPPIGSWCWCFFENENPSKPYYLSALDLENTKVLPECQVGGSPEKKWVIFKSHLGRTVVISDDPDDERVEITGKKRQLTSPPVGDTASVYTIDGNQTTVLIDERAGKEKILIKSHKGDYINFDIENRKLQISIESDVQFKSGGSMYFEAANSIHFKAGSDINEQAGGTINEKAGGPINLDGSKINENSGMAASATGATPNGDR